jgi:two-component system sensor histidine kinase KdpD
MIRRDRRGRLKIYLGYAAGVGKTYQMLLEGHRLKSEGVDVAVGIVETHGRAETSQLVEGLEVIPRRRVEYHGVVLEEMNLEAVLGRNPHVVLVDELAHTNVPGSSNGKRYQDVQEILAAGINVITTLNIQHLESLYDTVQRATGVQVKERLPDAILAEADQIVNVDLSAEDLQKRLRSGKIYPMERVTTALNNFFQDSHLEQLRELTLRELASQLDTKRREAHEEKNRGGTDQVMVCLDSRGSESAALLRYGSRLAGRLNRNWYAIHVQTIGEDPLTIDAGKQRVLSETLTLANQLGATVFTFKGEDIAGTLLRFALEHGVGYVILGKPSPHSWWRRFTGKKSVTTDLLQRSDGLNLIIIDPSKKNAPGDSVEESPESILSSTGARPTLRLRDFITAQKIVIWEDPVSKDQAIRDLMLALAGANPDLDYEKCLAQVLERESHGSTFLNESVALPHARIEGLKSIQLAFGLSHGGILDAHTQNPIEVVFLVLSPKGENKTHLQLLALASRFMLERILRRNLGKVHNSAEAYEIIKNGEGES